MEINEAEKELTWFWRNIYQKNENKIHEVWNREEREIYYKNQIEEEDSDVEDSPGKEDRVRKKSSVKDTQGALLKHLARKGV